MFQYKHCTCSVTNLRTDTWYWLLSAQSIVRLQRDLETREERLRQLEAQVHSHRLGINCVQLNSHQAASLASCLARLC